MTSTLLPPVITTKLFALPRRTDLLPRPRLYEKLIAGINAGAKIVLMAAPPGFGKSTAAAEIAAALRSAGRIVAWLGLDEEDNDTTRLLVHLIATLEQAIPGAGNAAHEQLVALVADGTPSPPPAPVLALLANALSRHAPPLLLVLDDYHVITDPALHHALASWIEQLPPQVSLLLCTRADPPLPLARWRVRRQLIEVRAAELQFTQAETAAFFEQVTQRQFAPEVAALAAARTEGWAAGLQLVALALEGEAAAAHDPVAWLAALGADDRYIADYLVEEVLARQPAAVQRFLLHTAFVERLHGSLCDALLALPPGSGQAMLEQVERANLFLVPLDQRRQWYRYHHLFRDLLRRQLQHSDPASVPTLHERAARWYAERGELDEGIEEALRGGIWELAVELMTTIFPVILRQGRWTTMRRWLAMLPPERLAESPRLSTWYAHMLTYTGEPARALELLASAEAAWRASGDVAGLVDALTVQMNLARLQDDPALVRTLAAQVSALNVPIGPVAEKTIACNLAIASQQAGEGPRAIAQLQAFLAATSDEQAPILTLLARSHMGDAYAELGEIEAAHAAYLNVVEVAKGRNLFPLLRAHMGLALLTLQRGKMEDAAHHAQEAIRLAQESERELYTAPAWLVLARVALALHDDDRAARLAQQSLELALKLGNARQIEASQAWRTQGIAAPVASRGSLVELVQDEEGGPDALTAREAEVLRLVAAGASNQQIAAELMISHNTVKKHIANLLAKLNAESRTHAIARARARGLI